METLLVLSNVWLEPKSSAAGTRMKQLIEFFQSQQYQIHYASTCLQSVYAEDLTAMGIDSHVIELNADGFDDFVKALNPEVVVFDRFMVEEQFGWRVAAQCPQAFRILDTEDFHSLRLARQAAAKQKRPFELTDLYSDTAKRELASMYRCDLTLIISEFEIQLLEKQFKMPQEMFFYLPFVTDLSTAFQKPFMPYEAKKDFVFIGNFLHEPNWNAVRYLKEEVWSSIRKALPEAKLHIYGAYPPDKLKQLLHEPSGFLVHGRAEDALAVLSDARVLLAPIQIGAGIKGKLYEAMLVGTPSVTTAVGAEAMQGDLPWNGYVVDGAQEFIACAISLYTEVAAYEKLQQNGKTLIEARYDGAVFLPALAERILNMRQDLATVRNNNFIGQIMQHHTQRSTEYFSRWITVKNNK